MGRFRWTIAGTFLLLQISGCLVIENQFSSLPPGPWRAILKLESVPVMSNPRGEPLPEKVNLKFNEVTQGELPFNFEVIYDNEQDFHIEIMNGEERIRVDDISIGQDRRTAKDTLIIRFPVFDSYIRAIFEENVMEGEWIVSNRENYSIPFVAYHGQNHRFTQLRKDPVTDISGRWEVMFGIDTEEPFPAIGDFHQDGNHLTGTFLTETGDYRFLEGTIQADKLYLSVFDGAHAYLFEAKIREDGTLIGSFWSGTHYKTLWEARRNESASLRDPLQLSSLKSGVDRVDFAFEDTDGNMISLDDERFRGKAKIIELFGTWCPNCRDATEFLVNYLAENKHPDLVVIGLAFERHRDREKARQALRTYREKLGVPYELLLAGYYDKTEAIRSFPVLDSLLAYPTFLFLNRQNEVEMIHTGFMGPATAEFNGFEQKFDRYIDRVLATAPEIQ